MAFEIKTKCGISQPVTWRPISWMQVTSLRRKSAFTHSSNSQSIAVTPSFLPPSLRAIVFGVGEWSLGLVLSSQEKFSSAQISGDVGAENYPQNVRLLFQGTCLQSRSDSWLSWTCRRETLTTTSIISWLLRSRLVYWVSQNTVTYDAPGMWAGYTVI